jgi:tripartite-type tricarboxylate transporter receptor subunit TctC
LLALLAATLVGGPFAAALAQEWPTRPIRWIVPQPPGGTADFIARAVAEKVSQRLGQPIIIDNKPGAGGNLGTDLGAKAQPDGYTIVLGTIGPIAVNSSLYKQLPFDPEHDLVPITLLADYPCVILANPAYVEKTRLSLASLSAHQGTPLNYASPGVGTSPHLAAELFAMTSGAKLTHVPYKGSAAGLNDVVAGHVPLMVDALQPTALSFVRGGRLTAIAVTSATRTPNLPDVPTVAEAGMPGFQVTGWMGVLAPRGTPEPIVGRLDKELSAVLALPEIKALFAEKGAMNIPPTGREHFRQFIRSETDTWRKVVKTANIQAE